MAGQLLEHHAKEIPLIMPGKLSPQERLRFEAEIIPQLDVLYRMARSVCRNTETAEDIAQEAFMRAVNGFSGLEPGTNSRSWLARIVHNTCRDFWRKHQRRPEESWDVSELAALENEDTVQDWEPDIIRNAFDDDVETALQDLPPRWRMALLLVDVEGFGYEEAARSLDMPAGTLRSALFRARRRVYKRLARDTGSDREEGTG